MILKITIIFTLLISTIVGQKTYPFHKKDKWFFTDSTFKRIGKKTYKDIIPCELGYFHVIKKAKLALADNSGKQLTDFLFDRIIYDNVFGLYIGYIGKTAYKIDRNGNVSLNDFWGHCGGGNVVIPYFETYTKNNKIGFLKRTQTKNVSYPDTFPAIYDKLLENYNGTAMVKAYKLWGVINENSEYILKPQYDSIVQVMGFEEVLGVIIIKNNFYGWLDNNSKIVIQPKYKNLGAFKHGYALVTTSNNKTGYITAKGIELFE